MCLQKLLHSRCSPRHFFFSFWILSLPAAFGVVMVLAQNLELKTARREIKDAMCDRLPPLRTTRRGL